jgi:hypothetical protein
MKKSRVIAFPAVVGILLFPACVIPLVFVDDSGRAMREIVHRTISLEPAGTVSIDTGAGDVIVRGWDRKEAEILAEDDWGRPGFRGDWIWGDSRRGLPDVSIDTFENFVRIQTRSSGREDVVRPVHYTLNVPRSVNLKDIRTGQGNVRVSDIFGRVRVDVDEGDVAVENYSGSLEVSVGQGSVEAEILDLRAEDDGRITVRRGDVTLYLQPEATVRLEMSVDNGILSSEFDLGQRPSAKRMSARIGTGEGATVSITVFNGNIRLKKTK